eukprot:TRINITY_DN8501_c0_g1_i4.p1 TRINITY_DN8501_c0_g1~~TRINITY_DN8501_c0_g1_i4.p1  ORF type:complete len:365 (-),score=78.76 TRINITY_DN8501_c0_g1_i4:126-1220(-)
MLFRHGARTPLAKIGTYDVATQTSTRWDCNDLPADQQAAFSATEGLHVLPGNCFGGQLTRLGEAQMTELGRRYRDHYLSKLHLVADLTTGIYVRTTDLVRTQVSARALLRGLLPTDLWPRVQFDVAAKGHETMYPNDQCASLVHAMRDQLRTATQRGESSAELRGKLQVALRSDNNRLRSDVVGDVCEMLRIHNHQLPLDVTPQLADEAKQELNRMYYDLFGTRRILELAVGKFLDEITDRIGTAVTEQSSPQRSVQQPLAIYVGHDGTVVCVMRALQMPHLFPSVGSALVFEVYQQQAPTTGLAIRQPDTSDEHFAVRVVFNGEVQTQPQCGGKTLCPLSEFTRNLRSYIPRQWDADCAAIKA